MYTYIHTRTYIRKFISWRPIVRNTDRSTVCTTPSMMPTGVYSTDDLPGTSGHTHTAQQGKACGGAFICYHFRTAFCCCCCSKRRFRSTFVRWTKLKDEQNRNRHTHTKKETLSGQVPTIGWCRGCRGCHGCHRCHRCVSL